MKKVLKGERERPCPRCETPVRYLKSVYGQQRYGWHWTNEDGSHHRCGDFIEVSVDKWEAQWRQAMERDVAPYEAAIER